MYLLKKLSWFFKLEWKRYTIGIIALSLVSVFNLIPPRVIGEVVDSIDLRRSQHRLYYGTYCYCSFQQLPCTDSVSCGAFLSLERRTR